MRFSLIAMMARQHVGSYLSDPATVNGGLNRWQDALRFASSHSGGTANEKLPRYPSHGTLSRSQREENLGRCTSQLDRHGVDLQGLTSQELASGSLKSTLILMNSLRKKYDSRYAYKDSRDGADGAVCAPTPPPEHVQYQTRSCHVQAVPAWPCRMPALSRPTVKKPPTVGYGLNGVILPGTLNQGDPPSVHRSPSAPLTRSSHAGATVPRHQPLQPTRPLTDTRGTSAEVPPPCEAWQETTTRPHSAQLVPRSMVNAETTSATTLGQVPATVQERLRRLLANQSTPGIVNGAFNLGEGELLTPPPPVPKSSMQNGYLPVNNRRTTQQSYIPSVPSDRLATTSRSQAILDHPPPPPAQPHIPPYHPPPQYLSHKDPHRVKSTDVSGRDLRSACNKLYTKSIAVASSGQTNSYSPLVKPKYATAPMTQRQSETNGHVKVTSREPSHAHVQPNTRGNIQSAQLTMRTSPAGSSSSPQSNGSCRLSLPCNDAMAPVAWQQETAIGCDVIDRPKRDQSELLLPAGSRHPHQAAAWRVSNDDDDDDDDEEAPLTPPLPPLSSDATPPLTPPASPPCRRKPPDIVTSASKPRAHNDARLQHGHLAVRAWDGRAKHSNGKATHRSSGTRTERAASKSTLALEDDMTADESDVRDLQRQMEQLEAIYSQLMHQGAARSRHSVSSMSSAATRAGRRTHVRHARHRHHEQKHISKRFARLESHVVTLARGVAQLSSEVRTHDTLRQDVEALGREMTEVRKGATTAAGGGASEWERFRGWVPSLTNPRRVKKLTKFFGQEPPLLHIFLRRLNYEKHIPKFDTEGITMVELPYMTEESLQKIGVPLGPSRRILQEAQMCFRQENFNIYIV